MSPPAAAAVAAVAGATARQRGLQRELYNTPPVPDIVPGLPAGDRMSVNQPDNPMAGAQFLTSAADLRGLPTEEAPEVAFAGRSNAGKSSAINAMCGRRNLARTSKTPGRTQLLNFFTLNEGLLVDLPGYGFARVPPRVRAAWQRMVEGYLTGRPQLRGVVLMMDVRHPLTEFDAQLLDWGAGVGLGFHVLLTKADKLSRNQQFKALHEVQKALPAHGVQLFSATRQIGVSEARTRVARWLDPNGL